MCRWAGGLQRTLICVSRGTVYELFVCILTARAEADGARGTFDGIFFNEISSRLLSRSSVRATFFRERKSVFVFLLPSNLDNNNFSRVLKIEK